MKFNHLVAKEVSLIELFINNLSTDFNFHPNPSCFLAYLTDISFFSNTHRKRSMNIDKQEEVELIDQTSQVLSNSVLIIFLYDCQCFLSLMPTILVEHFFLINPFYL